MARAASFVEGFSSEVQGRKSLLFCEQKRSKKNFVSLVWGRPGPPHPPRARRFFFWVGPRGPTTDPKGSGSFSLLPFYQGSVFPS
jgi:hypothetical protein